MSVFRPRLRIPRVGALFSPRAPQQRFQQRFQHTVPELPAGIRTAREDGIGKDPENPEEPDGASRLFTPWGVEIAWTQYMSLTIAKLNRLVAGSEYETLKTREIVERTARDPALAPIFNYASMAHNTEFFFESLSHEAVEISPELRDCLEASFGSMEALRREFLVTAMAMFGPGFVWLVKTKLPSQESQFRLLPTYLAGTPYPRAHFRRQTVDMNTVSSQGTGTDVWLARQQKAAYSAPVAAPGGVEGGEGGEQTGSESTSSALGISPAPKRLDITTAPPNSVSDNLVPLLCLNTWEHTWLPDYHVLFDGRESKRVYIEKWWNHINWDKVSTRADIQRRSFQT